MRTLSIEKEGIKIVDHRGYVDIELEHFPDHRDRFELRRCNRGFTVRWQILGELGFITAGYFNRVNAVNNYTDAQVVYEERKPKMVSNHAGDGKTEEGEQ